jgi:hypothetical protein
VGESFATSGRTGQQDLGHGEPRRGALCAVLPVVPESQANEIDTGPNGSPGLTGRRRSALRRYDRAKRRTNEGSHSNRHRTASGRPVDSAFNAFCEDNRCDVRATRTCSARPSRPAPDRRGRAQAFKKLTAVHLVQASGALDGVFQLFFDQGVCSCCPGHCDAAPEQDSRRGQARHRRRCEQPDRCRSRGGQSARRFVGPRLREECEGHEHFLKTSTFIGKPWEDSTQISLTARNKCIRGLRDDLCVLSEFLLCCGVSARVVHASGNGDASSAEAPLRRRPAPSQGVPSAPAAAAPPALPAQGESKAPAQEAVPPAAPSVAQRLPQRPAPRRKAADAGAVGSSELPQPFTRAEARTEARSRRRSPPRRPARRFGRRFPKTFNPSSRPWWAPPCRRRRPRFHPGRAWPQSRRRRAARCSPRSWPTTRWSQTSRR